MAEKTFVAAMKEFFGLKEGQTLQEFAAELRSLSDTDRAYFTAELERVGYTITAKAA